MKCRGAKWHCGGKSSKTTIMNNPDISLSKDNAMPRGQYIIIGLSTRALLPVATTAYWD